MLSSCSACVSSNLTQNSLSFDIPLVSLAFSFIITLALSLINIGSSAALNAVFSIANSALVTSYYITIGSMIYRRLQGGPLPAARYSLGKYGLAINIISLIYLAPIFVFSFFPGTPKPTPETMNWGIVMYGGIILFATAYYVIWGRHTYTPPHESIEELMAGRDAEYFTHHGDIEKEKGGEFQDESSAIGTGTDLNKEVATEKVGEADSR
jgi:hypothetical protein